MYALWAYLPFSQMNKAILWKGKGVLLSPLLHKPWVNLRRGRSGVRAGYSDGTELRNLTGSIQEKTETEPGKLDKPVIIPKWVMNGGGEFKEETGWLEPGEATWELQGSKHKVVDGTWDKAELGCSYYGTYGWGGVLKLSTGLVPCIPSVLVIKL